MNQKADYINYKLKRADDAIKAAEVLIKEGFWIDSLSKIYYAAFYAVNALLINIELNPKTHNGTKSLFHKEVYFKRVNRQEIWVFIRPFISKKIWGRLWEFCTDRWKGSSRIFKKRKKIYFKSKRNSKL